MSSLGLNALITKLIVDHKFQEEILNGKRQERINEFNLSCKERNAVLSIQADNLEQFVQRMTQWMESTETA